LRDALRDGKFDRVFTGGSITRVERPIQFWAIFSFFSAQVIGAAVQLAAMAWSLFTLVQ
jgi:hypothetical protein